MLFLFLFPGFVCFILFGDDAAKGSPGLMLLSSLLINDDLFSSEMDSIDKVLLSAESIRSYNSCVVRCIIYHTIPRDGGVC